jgi:hypothetical protein
LASFRRKRESADVGPRFRGGDGSADFHSLGWPAGPWKLRRKSCHSRESGNPVPPGHGPRPSTSSGQAFRGGDVLTFLRVDRWLMTAQNDRQERASG